jgi:hypothetical protein
LAIVLKRSVAGQAAKRVNRKVGPLPNTPVVELKEIGIGRVLTARQTTKKTIAVIKIRM